MNLHRHSRKRESAFGRTTITAAVLLAAVFAFGFFGNVRLFAREQAASFLSVAYAAVSGVSGASLLASSATPMSTGVPATNVTGTTTATLIGEVTRLSDENAQLKTLLSVKEHAVPVATARVLTRPGFSPYDTFLVGAGAEEGVTVGDLVIAAGDFAVGKVIEVSAHTAQVSLFSAPGNTLDVRRTDGTLFSYMGRGGGGGEADVAREVTLTQHEPIFLPGTSFMVGVVGGVQSAPEDAKQHVYIAPPVALASLEFVSVVPSPSNR